MTLWGLLSGVPALPASGSPAAGGPVSVLTIDTSLQLNVATNSVASATNSDSRLDAASLHRTGRRAGKDSYHLLVLP
jgi:hypothetical protein